MEEDLNVLTAEPRVLFFLPGNAANNIAREIVDREDPEIHRKVELCVVNTEGALIRTLFDSKEKSDEKLQRWLRSKRLNILQLNIDSEAVSGKTRHLAKGHGAGGDPEVAKRAFDQSSDKIEKIFERADFVVILGAGGGGTGSACLEKAAEKCRELKIPFLAMLITPFLSEGKKVVLADATRQRLLELGPVVVLQNNKLANRDIRFKEAWTQINQAGPFKLLVGLRTITQVVGNIVNGDLQDVLTALEGGNEIYLGYWEMSLLAPGKESSLFRLEKVVEELCNHPFQDRNVLNQGKRMFIWFEGPWTVEQAEGVQQGVERELTQSGKKDLHVKWAIRDVDEDTKMWAFLIVAGSSGVFSEAERLAEPLTIVQGNLGMIKGKCRGLPVELWVRASLAEDWNKAFHSVPPGLEVLDRLRPKIQAEDSQRRLLDLPELQRQEARSGGRRKILVGFGQEAPLDTEQGE